MRGQAGPAVDHEDHGIGFGDRLLGLARHFVQDAFLDQRLETTGIDHQVRLAAKLAVPVVTVTGQTGQIGDDSVARLGQAIEQRGFADIGSTNQD